MKSNYLLLLLIFFCAGTAWSQQLVSGNITDEFDSPIPFAKIYAKNSPALRTVADEDGYYEMRLNPGEYFLVFIHLGII